MTTQYDPSDLDAYNEKWKANYKLTGFGIDGMRYHYPCPFCAEPDYLTCGLVDMPERMREETVCEKCGRGSKMIDVDTPERRIFGYRMFGIHVKLVRTQGDWTPSYLPYGDA